MYNPTTLRKETDELHAHYPEPGDYWSDHGSGVCVVLRVDEHNVWYCTTKLTDKDGWTWDLSVIDNNSRSGFTKWLAYGTIPGFWATVSPNRMMWAAEEYEAAQKPVFNPMGHLTA